MNFKQFIIFFALFFLIFALIGYKNGSDDVSKPNYIKNEILKDISLVKVDTGYYLAFKQKNENLYIYNIDSDTLSEIDKKALFEKDYKSVQDQNLLNFLNSATFKALGAGALGYSVKDIFKSSKAIGKHCSSSKGRSTVFGVIAGSICGYYCGYWFGTYISLPSADSKDFKDLLKSDAYWVSAEKEIFKSDWFEVNSMILAMNNGPLKERMKSQRDSLFSVIKTDYNNDLIINSGHFVALMNIKNRIELFVD